MISKLQVFSTMFLLLLTACGTSSQPIQAIPLSTIIPTTYATTTSIPQDSLIPTSFPTTTSDPQDSADVDNSMVQDLVTLTPPVSQPIISTVLPQKYAIPIFTAPGDWILYTNSNPSYSFYYPPNASLNFQEIDPQRQAQRLTISLPIQPGTQMIDKDILIDIHSASPEGCYGYGNGFTQINDVSFVFSEGIFWYEISDHGRDPRGVFQSIYTTSTPQNGFCYQVWLEMSKHNDSSLPAPNPSDTSIDILLEILSTLKLD